MNYPWYDTWYFYCVLWLIQNGQLSGRSCFVERIDAAILVIVIVISYSAILVFGIVLLPDSMAPFV